MNINDPLVRMRASIARLSALALALGAMGKAGDDLSGPVVAELAGALDDAALDLRRDLQDAFAAAAREDAVAGGELASIEARIVELPPGTVFHQVALPDEVRLADAYRVLEGDLTDLCNATVLLTMAEERAIVPLAIDEIPAGFQVSAGQRLFLLAESETDALAYAATHVWQLAKAALAKWHATIHAAERAQVAA